MSHSVTDGFQSIIIMPITSIQNLIPPPSLRQFIFFFLDFSSSSSMGWILSFYCFRLLRSLSHWRRLKKQSLFRLSDRSLVSLRCAQLDWKINRDWCFPLWNFYSILCSSSSSSERQSNFHSFSLTVSTEWIFRQLLWLLYDLVPNHIWRNVGTSSTENNRFRLHLSSVVGDWQNCHGHDIQISDIKDDNFSVS